MTPERWRRIEELFERVAEMDPEKREEYLDQECGEDLLLRKQLHSLIISSQQADTFIHSAIRDAAKSVVSSEDQDSSGKQIGQYRIIRELGHGGMGTVFLAMRADDEYKKLVAIKLVNASVATQETLLRFRSERQILAYLDHPNIARLLDGGTTDRGIPYVVMEYIEGEPIDVYADRNSLSIASRLFLFRKVCSAVQYAHQGLVVHRDIKPANILVTQDGEPKLLDFGIAKLTVPDQSLPLPIETRTDTRLMTPEYASPEQVRGEPITTVCDIYSLGILLYELLTGRRPHQIKDYTPQEIERVICEQEPEKPSTAVGSNTVFTKKSGNAEVLSKLRNTTPKKLKRKLQGDLDNIVLMAMRKEPSRRYASAEQMSEDIRRHVEGLPVIARSSTFNYRARKFLKRNRTAVLSASVVTLLIVGLVGFYTNQLASERDRAQLEAEKARQVSSFLTGLFEVSDPGESKGETITTRELLERGAKKIEQQLTGQPEVQASMMTVMGNVYKSLGLFQNAKPLFEKALKIRKGIFGPVNPEVAESMNDLGMVFFEMGDYQAAEKLMLQSLAMRRDLLGRDHPSTAESLFGIGRLKFERGEFKKAEAYIGDSLAIRTKVFGEESVEAAESISSLSSVLHEIGNYDTAIELEQKALNIRRKLLGRNHPLVPASMQNLAVIMDTTGDYDAAELLYRETLEIERKIYGDEHPSLATTMVNLARVLRHKKNYSAAEALYRQVIELDRKLRGKDHPYVAYDLNSLAMVLHTKGDLTAAEPIYREAIEIYRKHPEDESLAPPLVGLGSLLTEMGDPVSAEPFLREGLDRWRKMVPEGHWRIALSEAALAGCLVKLNRLDEAEKLLPQSFEILKAKRGLQDRSTQRALNWLIEFYQARGKTDLVDQHQAMLQKSSQE